MSVKGYKTELAKYTLDKMRPNEACQQKIDYFKEELRQSREFHAQRVQRYKDDQQDDQQNLQGQLKDPSTHPSKSQELKIATTVAPVSAQSVKNDAVISRGRAPPTPRELEVSSKSKNKYK
jgi:hypothetical protein